MRFTHCPASFDAVLTQILITSTLVMILFLSDVAMLVEHRSLVRFTAEFLMIAGLRVDSSSGAWGLGGMGRVDRGGQPPRSTRPRVPLWWIQVAPAVRNGGGGDQFGPAEASGAALAEIHATVPAYLAGPETLRRFGAELADPPLRLRVDGEGRIAALIQARVKTRSTALRAGPKLARGDGSTGKYAVRQNEHSGPRTSVDRTARLSWKLL